MYEEVVVNYQRLGLPLMWNLVILDINNQVFVYHVFNRQDGSYFSRQYKELNVDNKIKLCKCDLYSLCAFFFLSAAYPI